MSGSGYKPPKTTGKTTKNELSALSCLASIVALLIIGYMHSNAFRYALN